MGECLRHHKQAKGKGYPNGLKGEESSIEGRSVAIADVFDAITLKSTYKEPWSIEQTIEHMQHQAGKHFDPHLVELFIGQIDAVLAIKKAHQERD